MLVIVYGMARVEMDYNLKTFGQRFQAQRLCLEKGDKKNYGLFSWRKFT